VRLRNIWASDTRNNIEQPDGGKLVDETEARFYLGIKKLLLKEAVE
jgi:hypothetical protein